MATTFGVSTFDDFSGGLDDTTASTKLPINRAQRARNFNLVPGGGLEKRKGSTTLGSAIDGLNAVTHLGEYVKSDGTKFLMATAGDTLKKQDAMDGTWDDLSLTLTSGQDILVDHAILNDLYVIVNNNEAPQKFDGSGAAALGGSPPVAKMIVMVNNFLFLGNIASNKSRVQWCTLATPETWPATNFLDVDPNDGDEVTALGVLFNNLYVFKNRSISRMPIINTPFSKERIATGIGCVGLKAIINVGGTHLVFMTPDGRFIAFDGSVITDISSKRILNKISSLNQTRWKFSSMVDYKKRRQILITLSAGGSSTHDVVLVYDYTNGITEGSWMEFTGIDANAFLSITDQRSSSTEKEVLLSGNFAGVSRIQDSGTANDDGTSVIDAFWETGWNFFDQQQSIKVVRAAEILATEEGDFTLDFKVGFDFETDFQFTESLSLAQGGAQWGSGIWGVDVWSGKNILQLPVILGGFGKAIKFGFQSKRAGHVLSLFRGFTVRAAVRGTRFQLV